MQLAPRPLEGCRTADPDGCSSGHRSGSSMFPFASGTDSAKLAAIDMLTANVMIADAKLKAYQAVKCIRWDGAWCRKDISDKANRY